MAMWRSLVAMSRLHCWFSALEHDPEEWIPFSEKIMLHQNARAQIASI
jgi:hypothetical protein